MYPLRGWLSAERRDCPNGAELFEAGHPKGEGFNAATASRPWMLAPANAWAGSAMAGLVIAGYAGSGGGEGGIARGALSRRGGYRDLLRGSRMHAEGCPKRLGRGLRHYRFAGDRRRGRFEPRYPCGHFCFRDRPDRPLRTSGNSLRRYRLNRGMRAAQSWSRSGQSAKRPRPICPQVTIVPIATPAVMAAFRHDRCNEERGVCLFRSVRSSSVSSSGWHCCMGPG